MARLRHLFWFKMTSRRLGLFLCLIGFVWGLTLMNMTLIGHSTEYEAENMKKEILRMSEKYVQTLAKDTENTIDGPYAGRLTGYDLKKTMAVLLDDIMNRLDRLEKKVDLALSNGTKMSDPKMLAGQAENKGVGRVKKEAVPPKEEDDAENAQRNSPVDAKGLILGKQEDCELTEDDARKYPHCRGKMNWMKSHWKSDPCYAEFGVDGSDCSFRVYLSEVEVWCPHLVGRTGRLLNNSTNAYKKAELNFNMQGLMAKLQDPGQRENYKWIRMRISRLWNRWVDGARSLAGQQDVSNRSAMRVVVHLGLLTKASGWKFAEGAFKGGPLGELVQWSDIITALYILGHDLTITSEVEQLQGFLKRSGNRAQPCPTKGVRAADLLFTDIMGLKQLKKFTKNNIAQFSCLLRIIDSFGTEPAFNYEPYAKTHKLKTQWGMQNLNPQQFFTMFPHSPDNSFMGFVVDNHINASDQVEIKKKNQALVYGKAEYMWQGKEKYLDIIKDYVEIHGTVFVEKPEKTILPGYVKNHGILSGPELHALLRESKIFIGLGFPYEGPAPLEAIAQGCVFINPKFTPAHNSQNTKFFKGKPTLRKVTSQHPYAEDFIGEPHVFTIDINKPEEVKSALQRALKAHEEEDVSLYLPYEFSEEGVLQRLNAYIEHQDFCNPFPNLWPPKDTVSIMVAQQGKSCKDVCREHDLICEPAHFKRINQQEELENHFGPCSSIARIEDIYFPAFQPTNKQCVLQNQPMLFSCVGEHAEYARLCPCRDYVKGQTALCKACV